ncbi:MAG: hypothetical protein HYS77_02300, partial [Candidatus Rokubacteria bacterium]|nr:hypothetical protein [Candidatus Rokubacteria bacterium]
MKSARAPLWKATTARPYSAAAATAGVPPSRASVSAPAAASHCCFGRHAGGEQRRPEGRVGPPEERWERRARDPVAELGDGGSRLAHAQHQDRAIEPRELRARMARVIGDDPVEELARRLAVVVEAQRLLGGELERVRRVGVPGEEARELEELPPRLVAPVLAQRAPGDAEPGVGRLRVVGELDEQAAEGRGGGGVVARVVVRLAGEQERGGAHLRGHARREHGPEVARGLGELAHLEVGAGQAHGGDPADTALAGPGEVVLRAGLVAVALEPPRLAEEQQHVGARRGRQRRAEQLLGERARLRRLARVHERAHQAHAQRRDQRRAAALEPLGQDLGAVHVGREQGQREAGLRPVLLGLDGRGRRRRRRRQVRAER